MESRSKVWSDVRDDHSTGMEPDMTCQSIKAWMDDIQVTQNEEFIMFEMNVLFMLFTA